MKKLILLIALLIPFSASAANMTIDEWATEEGQAMSGLSGDKEIVFVAKNNCAAGDVFTVSSIQKVGEVTVSYPNPNTVIPAHVLVELE